MSLNILLLSNNNYQLLADYLSSFSTIECTILVSDQNSTDGTVALLKKYGAKIWETSDTNLGKRKQFLIDQVKTEWILVLDADERLSEELIKEIKLVIKNGGVDAYLIPYQNFVFGKPVYFGGESYTKPRLFRKGFGRMSEKELHEEIIVHGKIGKLHGKILHYSFRTPRQLFSKFTTYSYLAAKEQMQNGERLTVKKLFVYGPHMFWARYIKDQGWRDGWRGFVLAFAFGYMEALTYWNLLWITQGKD